jgi:glycosyltransferase involved in cell wall biosynthesis
MTAVNEALQKTWVVIPALNEERAIRDVVQAVLAQGARVVVIDDGSSDATCERIADLPVTLLRHPRPQGKACGLLDGFRAALDAGCDGVITMDGDGQHDAGDIPRLLAAAARHPQHIVIGARLLAHDHQPGARRFGNAQADFWVSWACGQRIVDTQSGQRYYPRRAMEIALHLPEAGFVLESEILIEAAWRGMPAVSVPIAIRYQEGARASHFRPFRDVMRITRMIAGRLIPGGMRIPSLVRAMRHKPLLFDPSGDVA